ncbi:hypothetical protein D9M69_501290 [compost metagenome]
MQLAPIIVEPLIIGLVPQCLLEDACTPLDQFRAGVGIDGSGRGFPADCPYESFLEAVDGLALLVYEVLFVIVGEIVGASPTGEAQKLLPIPRNQSSKAEHLRKSAISTKWGSDARKLAHAGRQLPG